MATNASKRMLIFLYGFTGNGGGILFMTISQLQTCLKSYHLNKYINYKKKNK